MPTPTTIQITGGNNQSVNLNTTFGQQVSCVVRDENGNIMLNEGIVWSVPQTGPSGNFPTTGSAPYTTTTGAGGSGFSSAMFANGTAGAWLGAVQSTAQLGVNAVFNITNTNNPVPTSLSASANGIQSAAKNAAYLPASVLVRDQFNAPMAGITVTFTVPSGRGTWPGGGSLSRTATTNGSGIATSPVLTASATLGQFSITVAAGSQSSTSIVRFTTVDPAVVTSLSANSGSNQVTAPSFPFGAPLVARAANALNQPVAGVSVLFTSPASGASCTFPTLFATTTAISDANGLATTSIPTANATAGSYSVVASFTGASNANFGMTNGGSPPDTTDSLAMCEA